MLASDGPLRGRVALVTGASSGLGDRFARVLSTAGAEVVVTARRSDRLGRLADEIGGVAATAVVDMCRVTAPLLFAGEGASVINVASIYGLVASRTPMAAYNATKGAVVQLTRHLAAQWGPRGVRVNALAPGYFPTELTGMLAGDDLVARIRSDTLLGRVPSIDEIDGPLLFLASDASSYVTGHTLVVDGGWTSA